MSGQSSTTPFMRESHKNNQSTRNSCKKGVACDALEAVQKNNDSIDKLTSLVSRMNMEIDKHEAQYKLQVYQGRKRGQYNHERSRDNYQPRNRSYSRDRNMLYRGRRNYNKNYRSNYRGRSRDNYRYDDR